jgi:hypothetical protein
MKAEYLTLMMGTEMVPEEPVSLNQLTQVIKWRIFASTRNPNPADSLATKFTGIRDLYSVQMYLNVSAFYNLNMWVLES